MTRKQVLAPMATRRVGYQKSYRVHNSGEIAAPILESAFIGASPPRADDSAAGNSWLNGETYYTRVTGSGYLEEADGTPVRDANGNRIEAAWIIAAAQPILDGVRNAEAALDLIAPFGDDGQIDTTEKKALVIQVATLTASINGLLSRASDLGITGLATTLSTAWGAFLTFINAIDPPYTSTNIASDVDRDAYKSLRGALDDAMAAVDSAISTRDSYRSDKLVPPPSQQILYDYTGTTTTDLPKVLQWRMLRGSADITADTTFAFAVSGGTISTADLDPGQVSLDSVTATNGSLTCTATPPDGTPQQLSITLSRQLGQNPGGSGGGGSGATSFSVSVSASISDTSYDGSPQLLFTPAAQIRANGSGQIRLTLNAGYEIGTGTAQLFAKAQKSTDNSSWTDISSGSATGSEAQGGYFDTPPGQLPGYDDYVPPVPGSIAFNSLLSGFTASTDYYIRWIAYKSGAGGSLGVSGTASGAQS